jgi:hypothetical protein
MRKPDRVPSLPDLLDAELEALGIVTQADRDDAGVMWKRDAPPAARTLLDASEYEGEDGG